MSEHFRRQVYAYSRSYTRFLPFLTCCDNPTSRNEIWLCFDFFHFLLPNAQSSTIFFNSSNNENMAAPSFAVTGFHLFLYLFILLTNFMACIALCQALGLEQDEFSQYPHEAKKSRVEQETGNKHMSKWRPPPIVTCEKWHQENGLRLNRGEMSSFI